MKQMPWISTLLTETMFESYSSDFHEMKGYFSLTGIAVVLCGTSLCMCVWYLGLTPLWELKDGEYDRYEHVWLYLQHDPN